MKRSVTSHKLGVASLFCASVFACASLPGCAETYASAKEPGVDLTQPPPPPGGSSAAGGGDAGASLVTPNPDADDDSLNAIFNTPKDEGLTWTDIAVGAGQSAQLGDIAKIHYIGRLAATGVEFDNSHNRPGAFEFSMGHGMVIKGFERGMVGMRVGGVRTIHVPWKLAYGVGGNPPRIPSKADLIFEIELLDIPVPIPKDAPKKSGPSGVGSMN